MTSPIADFVVSLGSDGRLLSQEARSTALKLNTFLSAELEKGQEEIAGEEVDTVAPDVPIRQDAGKLILAEEISEGHVSWAACGYSVLSKSYGLTVFTVKLLFASMGGPDWITFWCLVVGTSALSEVLTATVSYLSNILLPFGPDVNFPEHLVPM